MVRLASFCDSKGLSQENVFDLQTNQSRDIPPLPDPYTFGAIFLCLSHPRARYQAIRDHVDNCRTWWNYSNQPILNCSYCPALPVSQKCHEDSSLGFSPIPAFCLLTTLRLSHVACMAWCALHPILGLGSLINLFSWASPMLPFVATPDWQSHKRTQIKTQDIKIWGIQGMVCVCVCVCVCVRVQLLQ